jgi:RNA polymerase sigma-70 factor (ECF subfamily)
MQEVEGTVTLERLDLERCVSSLPEGQREVLLLFDIQGYSHNEIAKMLEIAPGTSKNRLFEARSAMRRELGYEPASSGSTL